MDRPRKKSSKRFVFLLVFAGLIFLGYKGFLSYLSSPVDVNAKPKAFVVEKGETASSIADKLQSENIIRSAWIFKRVYQEKNSPKIEAGTFKLSSAMTQDQIIETLSKGALDKWITLLEGWRIEEMADKLNSEIGTDTQEFIKKSKEGYMFPDTYLFNPDATVETITSTLRNNFDKKYSDDLQSKIKSKGLTPEEGIILASLVEREARSDEVRTKVAGIILKRLKIGMKLDIDSTVRYAKDSQTLKQKGKVDKYWQGITQDDYSNVKSPYNTYLNNGLPPGPICNPSLSSLKAVANADSSTPYLYYYHDSKGNSYYATNLDDHNRNVAEHP